MNQKYFPVLLFNLIFLNTVFFSVAIAENYKAQNENRLSAESAIKILLLGTKEASITSFILNSNASSTYIAKITSSDNTTLELWGTTNESGNIQEITDYRFTFLNGTYEYFKLNSDQKPIFYRNTEGYGFFVHNYLSQNEIEVTYFSPDGMFQRGYLDLDESKSVSLCSKRLENNQEACANVQTALLNLCNNPYVEALSIIKNIMITCGALDIVICGPTGEVFPCVLLGVGTSYLLNAFCNAGVGFIINKIDCYDVLTQELEAENKPPEKVIIFQPVDDSTFEEGDTIAFSGFATDIEDGQLTGSSLVWESSLDGVLGTGEEFTINDNDLTDGLHTISLHAYDSEGLSSSATASVTIEDPNTTTCLLQAPNPSSTSTNEYFVTFNWSSVENASHYHIRIGGSATNLTTQEIADCGGPVTSCQERLADSTQFTEYMGTAPHGTYYWSVVAVCDDGSRGEWSTPRSFTYVEVDPPDPEF